MTYRRVTTATQKAQNAEEVKPILRITKTAQIFCSPSYDSQISSNESSSDDRSSHFHDKKVRFLTGNSRKGKYKSHNSHAKTENSQHSQ